MKNFLLNLLDWIYKKKCYCCSSSKECVAMCSKCYSELEHNPPFPDRIYNNCNIFIAGSYEKHLQKIIRGLKYHNKKDLAYYIAKFMYEYYQTLDINEKYQVVPVPLHSKRQKKRGYNHMELIAEEFCKMTGFTLNTQLITRVKDTKPQYKLSKNERIRNLENAFKIDKSKLLDLPILIIDDICTSGATLESIINELNKEKIYNIVCLATTSPN